MTKSVTIIIINKDNKFALQLRSNKKNLRYANMWVFPGGGIEDNESPYATASREFEEEFGIAAIPENFSKVGIYQHDDEEDYLMAYAGDKLPTKINEGQKIEYFSLATIKSMSLGFHQQLLLPLIESTYHEK